MSIVDIDSRDKIMKVVWILSSGMIYEGGSVDAVFSSKVKAIAAAKKQVREENKRYKEYVKEDPDYGLELYKKTDDGRWMRAGMDYIKVVKWEVK